MAESFFDFITLFTGLCGAFLMTINLGLPFRLALRNALLPVITFIGWWGGRLLGGIVIMEIIFGLPGMGTSLIDAVDHRDYPTVQAIVFLLAMVFLLINLTIDLLYAVLDPRIRYS
jgi:ABC-type dipeptide/oligopeptide/nickel transport system permease component